MVLSTRDIKAIDPVTGDTAWDEPPDSMSAYDELEFLRALTDKIANAPQGHDSLGPTGLVIHPTPQERDAIVRALERRAADLRDQIQRADR